MCTHNRVCVCSIQIAIWRISERYCASRSARLCWLERRRRVNRVCVCAVCVVIYFASWEWLSRSDGGKRRHMCGLYASNNLVRRLRQSAGGAATPPHMYVVMIKYSLS